MHWSSYILVAVCSYLVGSVPTGYLMGRARGMDIRKLGSGNIGATNVFRFLGKKAGIAVLLIDALKGYLPAFLASVLLNPADPDSREYCAMVAGFAAILGHNYTCWLNFKGGKGIATSAGVLLALAPRGFGITLAVWIATFAVTKYVSLASVVAAAALPLAVWLTGGTPRMVGLTSVLGALAIYKHRANIQRLIAGTEHRFGKEVK